jgi:hypothetical protein
MSMPGTVISRFVSALASASRAISRSTIDRNAVDPIPEGADCCGSRQAAGLR